MDMETRTLAAAPECRAARGGRTIAGYAAVFNVEADIGGLFRERIAPGAFAEAVKGDVRALVDHDHGRVIGRTAAGTLRLREDDTGLAFEIDLPDTTDGRDLAALVERGDLTGMSFGFRTLKESWDESGPSPLRTVELVDLFEISAVAFPAYDDTSIALRSLEAARKERRAHNYGAAARRIAERKARAEQRFRRI